MLKNTEQAGEAAHSGLLKKWTNKQKQQVTGWNWSTVILTLTEGREFSNNAELA